MLGIGRGSREGVISREASQWSVALRLLREGLRLGVQLVPGHYTATASACRKGGQWQHVLSVLSDMWEAKLEPNVIFSAMQGPVRARRASSGSGYNAGISACEKGEQWQRALALLSEMWEAKLEPDVISYSAGISACEKGEQWQRALALLSEMWEGEQWQPALALLREIWEAKLEPNVIFSYSAGISACEKGEQWQRALALLSEMWEAKL
ncbi:unnamed protein product, partial [Prorocentrum cordatum]